MLSSTYTITDVKAKLENDYVYYGFSSDALFVASITSISEDVYRMDFLPRIGEDSYNEIKTKNKTGLTEYETNLYWAEVFTICYNFLKSRLAKTGQLQSSSDESLSVEGYSYRTALGSGSSPSDSSFKFYFSKAFTYWKLAGFNIMSLERTCTIFGDSAISTFGETIIE